MTGSRPEQVQEQVPEVQQGPSIVKTQIKGIKIRFLPLHITTLISSAAFPASSIAPCSISINIHPPE